MRAHYLSAMAVVVATVSCSESPLGSEAACGAGTAYVVSSTVSGSITAEDCSRNGVTGDYYTFSAVSHTSFGLTMQPSGFNGELGLYAGTPGGTSTVVFETDGSSTFGANAFLPPGNYYIVAGTRGGGGSYTLVSQPVPVSGCGQFLSYTRPGATISGVVTGNDCVGLGVARFDAFEILLESGHTISASATMDKAGAISIRSGSASSPDLASHILSAPGVAQVSYTTTRRDSYRVHVYGSPGMQGNNVYTLTIQ